MKALIFDGSPEGDTAGFKIGGTLRTVLQEKGYRVMHVMLRDKTIGFCSGCFNCWLKTPGICIRNDDNRDLSRELMMSDLLIMMTPITFGGYAPELKGMADHLIANISPFFSMTGGETHHRKRYERYPDIVTVGWLGEPDSCQEEVFRQLTLRNSINFHAKKTACCVISASSGPETIRKEIAFSLSNLQNPEVAREQPVTAQQDAAALTAPVRKALLLVGSPRMANSTSASLGGYLLNELEARGVATETLLIYDSLHDTGKRTGLLDAVDRADLCILSFPTYIDSIPAPVLSIMQQIYERRRSRSYPEVGFAAIANCGFIESVHNETALAICSLFAAACGFVWMGSVSIGGGEGLVHGRSLSDLRGPATPYKKNLALVADALSRGMAVPGDIRRNLARPFIPSWLYRFIGGENWKKQARRNGVLQKMGDRPYQRGV